MKPRNGQPGSHPGTPNGGPDTAAQAFDLDSAIRAVRAEQGSAAQALALEQRLAATLGPAALAGAGGASGVGGVWGSGGWLLVLGLGALGALALHAYEGARPRSASVLHAEPRAAALAPVQLRQAAAPALAPLPSTRATPAQARRAPRHAHAHAAGNAAAHAGAHVVSNAPDAIDAEGELALLQRSRAALHSDPVAALALAEQHARAYPHGMFAQEREVLAIEALLRSHARAAAFARARAFVSSHPDSPYAPRIRALLAQLPAGPGPSDPAAEPPER